MNIDQLPVEMLMKIFSFLPNNNEVFRVSKHFYDVACSANVLSIRLNIDRYFFEEENHTILQSVKHSRRSVSKMDINFSDCTETEIRSTMSIIKNFSSTIKYFKISVVESSFATSDFDEILSLLPNVVHLVVVVFAFNDLQDQPITKKLKRNHRKMSNNDYPKLHQLRTLELWGVYYDDEDKLSILIKRQTNIKNLILKTLKVNIAIFDTLKLDALELCMYDKTIEIVTLLSKQTQLKSLRMQNDDSDVMNVILNQLTELEVCSLTFHCIDAPASLMNFGKLKQLKHLSLLRIRTEHLAHLPKFDESRIVRLDLDISSFGGFSNDQIQAIAKFAPNLKVFRLKCSHNFNYYALNAIMRHLNFVEVLQIKDSQSRYFYNTLPLMQGECFNQKLLELNIDYGFLYDRAFLMKLIADYPQLKKLTIRSMTPLNAKHFQLMLNGFPKIESITLMRGASKLTAEDMQCLKHDKKNLKFISFYDSNRAVSDKIKKMDLFDVINVVDRWDHDECHLDMAVDRRTMTCELQSRDFNFLKSY